jgi:histidine triad (HIT) family protein
MTCAFCDILSGDAPGSFAFRRDGLAIFADSGPIRPGHVQIVPEVHVETFEDLAPDSVSAIVLLGQRVARVQKRLYGVRRVGFVFSGNDVAHVHAHVIPLHDKTDLTSMRFFALGSNLPRRDLSISRAEMDCTAAKLAEALV